jgi:hypothetical protein
MGCGVRDPPNAKTIKKKKKFWESARKYYYFLTEVQRKFVFNKLHSMRKNRQALHGKISPGKGRRLFL